MVNGFTLLTMRSARSQLKAEERKMGGRRQTRREYASEVPSPQWCRREESNPRPTESGTRSVSDYFCL
jgi:hypothetical protein